MCYSDWNRARLVSYDIGSGNGAVVGFVVGSPSQPIHFHFKFTLFLGIIFSFHDFLFLRV